MVREIVMCLDWKGAKIMFKCEIKTGGSAFCDPCTGEESEYWESVELNRILADICLKIEEGETSGSCMDINGNKVGKWSR